jgi:hypothetical protein
MSLAQRTRLSPVPLRPFYDKSFDPVIRSPGQKVLRS